MKAVYKMIFDAGRMGSLSGTFVAEKEHVELLVNDGIRVYFGEKLGKHSEIAGPVDEDEIKMLTDDPEVVLTVERYELESGYNPFWHRPMDLEEDEHHCETVIELIEYRLNKKQKNERF
jgi:hypothetical protein